MLTGGGGGVESAIDYRTYSVIVEFRRVSTLPPGSFIDFKFM